MKYLKLYENFEDIDQICQQYGIKNYTINPDRTVDVDGRVDFEKEGLLKLPLKFGKIYGWFDCTNNRLTSLKGSPIYVEKWFGCGRNKLTTLIDGPKTVLETYYCHNNNLKDVHGFPEYFNHIISIGGNPVDEILSLVYQDYKTKFIKWLNEYDVIRPGNKIVEMRLEEAYYMTYKEELPIKKRTFKNYTLI